jgi:sulfate permease, SulP family
LSMRILKPAGLVRISRRLPRPRSASCVRKSAMSAAVLLGVLVFGILPGLIIGVAISLALIIKLSSSPNRAVLGREPGGKWFADITNNPEYETVPGLLIYRFDAPLVFTNADRFSNDLRDLVNYTEPDVRQVVIDAEDIPRMDTTASEQFKDLIKAFERAGIKVVMARAHAALKDFMVRDGVVEMLGEDSFFLHISDALAAFKEPA